MGSKAKYAKYIVPILQKAIQDNNVDTYIECFTGGANIIDKIDCKYKYGYDRSDTLIALLQQAQSNFDGVLKEGSRELWDKGKEYVKNGIMPEDMSLADVGAMEFLASFSNGGFPRGYAKNTSTRDYYNEAYRNLEAQAPALKDIIFKCQNYWELGPVKNAVIYCFDKNTEILTKDGWKLFKDVNIASDTFLSREPNTKELNYLKADYYTHYHYTGKMLEYKGRQLDFCVTPDHKIFYMKKHGRAKKKNEGFMIAKDFSEKCNNCYLIKAGGNWSGTNSENFDLCGQPVNFIQFSRLLGIFLIDGSINNQDSITIIQKKPNIQNIIENLLNELKIEHSIYNNKNGSKTYYIHRKYVPFFKQFYLKEHRHIPTEFKNASKEAIQNLIEGILDGDSDQERRKIWLSSKTLVDDIQECLYKIGKASNYSIREPRKSYCALEDRCIQGTMPQYTISILETEYPTCSSENITWVDYDDEVYCVTLEKWHTVLIRRNGKTVWMGQCDPPYQGTKAYGYANQPKMDYDHFWNWVRELSKDNFVFVSEQSAPPDFEPVWEQDVVRTTNKKNDFKAVERLYVLKS